MCSTTKRLNYTMKKISIFSLIVLTVGMLIISCAQSPSGIKETATLYVETNQKGIAVASIVPVTPTILKYKVDLIQNEEVKYSQNFDKDEQILLENIKIGTYKLIISGYTDTGMLNRVVEGISDNITIYPDSSDGNRNHFVVTLSYLSQGKGSISLIIDWSELTATGNLIDDAIKSGTLGFLAFKASDNMPLSGNATPEQIEDRIKWAENPSSIKSMEYTESGLEANKTGEEIYFRIYSRLDNELTVIAETFRTSLQVYPNLESIPDANDKYNFTLTNNNVLNYLKNVIDPVAEPASDTSLVISWTNPEFSDDIYPITVIVKAKNNSDGSISPAVEKEFMNKSEKEGSATISNLSSDNTYSIYFQIKGQVGYSSDAALISDARPRIPVQSIDFAEETKTELVRGDKTIFDAIVSPAEATNKDFSLSSENQNVEITGKEAQFNEFGEYTMVITSDDNPTVKAEKLIIVHLPSPSNVAINAVNTDGVSLSWDEVNGATKYIISRNDDVTFESNTNSYTDTTVETGKTYQYTVSAAADDERFTSAESETTNSVSIDTADIEITIEKIPSIDFSEIFSEYNGTIINKEHTSLSINITESIPEAINYKWQLNGTTLKEGDYSTASNITIDENTAGLNKNSYESSNELILYVTINGQIYSGKLSILYSSSETPVAELTGIHTNDGNQVITFGTDEQFIADFNGVSGLVTWSSSDPDIISIDKNTGIAKSLTKGSATITATLAADQNKKASLEVESYIPVSSVRIIEPSREYLILERANNGVVVNDSTLKTITLQSEIVAANGVENGYSAIPTWNSDNTVINVDPSGTISATSSGKAGISISIDGITSNVVSVYALDVDIIQDGNIVTGQDYAMNVRSESEISLSFTYKTDSDLTLNYFDKTNWSNSGLTNFWTFSTDDLHKVEGEKNLLKLTIKPSNFTGIIDRNTNYYDYTIYSVITDNNEAKKITLSFTSSGK